LLKAFPDAAMGHLLKYDLGQFFTLKACPC
jgi:hypothetical protein